MHIIIIIAAIRAKWENGRLFAFRAMMGFLIDQKPSKATIMDEAQAETVKLSISFAIGPHRILWIILLLQLLLLVYRNRIMDHHSE